MTEGAGETGRWANSTQPHGYGRYSGGCRCGICRAAKAAYMRERRAAGRRIAELRDEVAGLRHGTRFAYEERGCRCAPCVSAKRGIWATEGRARAERAVSA